MTIAPPRPAAVEEVDTSALRRQASGIALVAGVLLVPVVVALALTFAQHRAWAPVLRDGLRSPAEVIGASYGRLSDRVRVAFATADGRLVEASIPVDDITPYWLGASVEVAYDPANPKRVRTVEGWNPPYVIAGISAAVLAVFALALLRRARRWPRRLLRVARQGPPGRPMVLASVALPGRATTYWGVLWEPGTEASSPPQLAFRLADESDAPEAPIDVELLGRPGRKMVGVVRAPTGMIWPAGKVRRPGRQLRRVVARPSAVEPSEAELAAVSAGGPLPRSVDQPRVQGDLPPLPPEFFDRTPKSAVPRARLLVAMVPALLAASAPFVLPDIIESRRHTCPTPPAAAAGAAGLLSAGELAASLPASLPGYTLLSERERGLGSFTTPWTASAAALAGFTSGYQRMFTAGGTTVRLEVFQFASETGPLRYEAQRLVGLCTSERRSISLPRGSGATGAVFGGLHRMSFVRGNRAYLANMEGTGVTGEAAVLEHLLATAR